MVQTQSADCASKKSACARYGCDRPYDAPDGWVLDAQFAFDATSHSPSTIISTPQWPSKLEGRLQQPLPESLLSHRRRDWLGFFEHHPIAFGTHAEATSACCACTHCILSRMIRHLRLRLLGFCVRFVDHADRASMTEAPRYIAVLLQ